MTNIFGMNTPDMFGLKIHESPIMPENVEETIVYPGHPIVKWFAKFLGEESNKSYQY